MTTMTAAEAGLLPCHACHLLHRPSQVAHGLVCVRCGATLHLRKPDSITRVWAFLIAAYILYVPANVLPVMETGSLFGSQTDTIMSGVVYLWTSGSWPLAAIIFIASIMVPGSKLIALTFLLVSVQLRSICSHQARTRLIRVA